MIGLLNTFRKKVIWWFSENIQDNLTFLSQNLSCHIFIGQIVNSWIFIQPTILVNYFLLYWNWKALLSRTFKLITQVFVVTVEWSGTITPCCLLCWNKLCWYLGYASQFATALKVAARLWFSFLVTSVKTFQKVMFYKITNGIIFVGHSKKFSGIKWKVETLFIKWNCLCLHLALVSSDFFSQKFPETLIWGVCRSNISKRKSNLPKECFKKYIN